MTSTSVHLKKFVGAEVMGKVNVSPEQWTIARAQWEADPVVTYLEIAESLGVSKQAVFAKAKRNGWVKSKDQRTVAVEAHRAADSKVSHSAVGEVSRPASVDDFAPETRPIRTLPVIPPDSSPEQARSVAEETVVTERAAIITRHRKELMNVRQVVYGALKAKTWEEGRMAKVLAEAVKVVHDAERKAWGLDGEEPGTKNKPASSVAITVVRRQGAKVVN